MTTDSPAPVPAQQPHAARSESSSPSLDDGQENASSPSMLQRVRAAIPPVSILVLTAVFLFAGWFTLFGPINVLAWRGGTFPRTEADRPYYQQALKDVARYQYEEQPSPEVYFGLACGATDDDIRSVIPKVGEHPNSDADPTADADAVAAAAATRPGSAPTAANQTAKLNPNLDAFGNTVDCSGSWTAPFLSFLLASAGVPVFDTPEDSAANSATDNNNAEQYNTAQNRTAQNSTATTENPWLVTDVEQLMDAYKAHDAFVTDKDFSPQVGDIIFYRYPASLGVHANMVVAVQGDWVTIGGDELGKVGLASMTLRNRGGIVGYGATGYFEQAPLDATK
ncbi:MULTISPECIES: hypothetical protein [unclassified Corynebacterium]|uniref:hypothetical protein n=1 Tax=unclassified Corynebacterium TaxID=2624378 RepID=UPI000AF77CF1|nr:MULTISPECIES: hypothetical protein [unclassified Corynebacterium]